MRIPQTSWVGPLVAVTALFLTSGTATDSFAAPAPIPFAIQGPGLNPAQFRVTAFATGLNYPVGMVELSDGSILATSTDGPGFFNSNARLLRFVDANKDGFADGPPTVLFNGLTGGITSVQIGGQLVFVTGQNKPIAVLRMGATPAAMFTMVGRLDINYGGGGWLHPHSALAVRPTTGVPRRYELFFQIGSKVNFGVSTTTASFTTTNLGGLSGTLLGDSVYSIAFTDNGTNVIASNPTQILYGVRNPSGFAFHPANGDLYFEDNGIDGLVDANEPHGADELNILPAAAIGGAGAANVEFYGYPANYTAYRTGVIVGGQGIQPLVAFQPLPSPASGAESEGPNDIAFAPPAFPDPLNNGVFVTFHGKFGSGGLNNEENPLVFVDLNTTNYFHFIPPRLPGVGHLDGLLRVTDSLFISDMSTNGALNMAAGRGVIYQVKALVGPPVTVRWVGQQLELSWRHGTLQSSANLPGGWTDVSDVSPHTFNPVDPLDSRRFFRVRN
jgi:glucose/arabinose dehydrogenase